MNSKEMRRAVFLIFFAFIYTSHAKLAKKANVVSSSSPSGSDFSYESNYANQGEGSINLLNGSAIQKINLSTIATNAGLTYDVNLYYNGAIHGMVRADNSIAPTGLVGLGWSFSPEAIFVDAKGTVSTSDDEYFYIEQNGVINQILRQGNGTSESPYTYQIKFRPYLKIVYSNASWTVTQPDGTRFLFGNTFDSRRYFNHGSGDFTSCSNAQTFTYQWDLGTIALPNGSGNISFKYKNISNYRCFSSSQRIVRYHIGTKQHHCINWGCYYWNNGVLKVPCDLYDCLENNDVNCLFDNADYYWSATDLQNTAPGLVRPANLADWYIEKDYTEWGWTLLEGDHWEVYLAQRMPVDVTYLGDYTSYSVLSSISNDRKEEIRFGYKSKSSDEYETRTMGVNDIFLKEIDFYRDNIRLEQIMLSYSGEENQIPHIDVGLGSKKRLLTGIKSSLINKVNLLFEYCGPADYTGFLEKVVYPLTGKKITYKYGLQTIDSPVGEAGRVEVIKKVIISNGVASAPDIIKTFTYTTSSAEQVIDEGSGIPYWGKVVENLTTGKIVTNFEVQKATNKFGTCKSVEVYSTDSKLISSESYDYAVQSFGPAGDCWYMPVLIQTSNTKDGVSKNSGTSVCAIDANSGMARLSWVSNNNGKTLVTERKYAYEANPLMGSTDKNMLSQVATTKFIELDNYNPATCDVSSGKVVKATHTVWGDFSSNSTGLWLPKETYAWNHPSSSGLQVAVFHEFDKATPTANGWQRINSIEKYDAFNRILQVSNALGITSTMVYGTPWHLPVAAVENSKYGECYFTSFEENEIWNFNIGGAMQIPRSNEKQKNGQYAALLDNSGPTEIYAEAPWRSLDQGLPAAKEYTFSGWVYTTGPQAEVFFLASVNGQSYEPGHHTSIVTPADAANKWVFLKGTFEAPAGAKFFTIRVDNNGKVGTSTKVYFEDLKYYPTDAIMNATYYDPKWHTPVLTVDANENSSQLITNDNFGRPIEWHKVDKSKGANEDGYKKALVTKKEYHLMGEDLRLLSPNGSERLIPGQWYSITWSGPATVGTNGVDLYFYNGSAWSLITNASQLKNRNSFAWEVPTNATGCKIKIQAHGSTSLSDESDESFTISNYLSTTNLSEDVTWWAGRNWAPTYTIEWNSGGSVANVRLEYFDGTNWKTIVSSTPNDGSYDWAPKGAKGPGLTRIRISEAGTGDFAMVGGLFNLLLNHGYVRRIGYR